MPRALVFPSVAASTVTTMRVRLYLSLPRFCDFACYAFAYLNVFSLAMLLVCSLLPGPADVTLKRVTIWAIESCAFMCTAAVVVPRCLWSMVWGLSAFDATSATMTVCDRPRLLAHRLRLCGVPCCAIVGHRNLIAGFTTAIVCHALWIALYVALVPPLVDLWHSVELGMMCATVSEIGHSRVNDAHI